MNYKEIDTQELDVREVIEEGLRLCRDDDWAGGMELLWKVARKEERGTKLPAIYYSYAGYGAAKLQKNTKEGLSLCRHAVKLDPTEADNFLNLARVEMLRNNRRGAVKALQRGLRLSPANPRLKEFQKEIGYRRPPVVPFLSRDSRLNIWLGKRRYLRELEKGLSN